MTDDNQPPEIQKIQETIRNLQSLKEQGLLPAEQADASIATLRKRLSTYPVGVEGDGAPAQGIDALAAGRDNVLIDGDMGDGSVFIKGDRNQVNINTEPRAKKDSLREAYLNYMLSLTSPLALSGVVRQSASNAETQVGLSAVYTALLTLRKSEEEHRAEVGTRKDFLPGSDVMRTQRRLSVIEQINRHKRLVLLGEPGSGKSTFINFLALCMVGQALGREDANLSVLTRPLPLDKDEAGQEKEQEQTSQPWDHGTLLPIRIILRDFAVRNLPGGDAVVSAENIWKFIEDELKDAALDEFVPFLKKELRDQGGLLLFDGLDEVPAAERRREQIRQAIESFSASFPRCRFIVTSRTYAYHNQDWQLSGFSETILAPFTRAQISEFVEHWYAHIARIRNQDPEDAQGKADLLKRAIYSNERLMGLAERPLLLTLMASLHAWRGGKLVNKREELYADAVDLLLDWWESQRIVRDSKGNVQMIQPSLAEWLQIDRKKVRDLLNQIAYDAHAGQAEIVGTADVSEKALVTGLIDLSQNPDVKPARLIEYMRDRAGLLISRGVGVYTFPHRTFQEYLAACYLTDHDYPEAVAELARKEPYRWREVALLAGAKAARGAADFALWALVDALSPEMETDQTEKRYWGAQIAGQAVAEIANLEKTSSSIASKIQRIQTRLLDILEGNHLPAIERAQASANLAVLGDPRFDGNCLFLPKEPLLGFRPIPKGKFLMGSHPDLDRQADEDELPQHELDIPYDYYLARYPVTVAQYKLFVEECGYTTSDADSLKEAFNHPAVSISWYDALKYCDWLDQKLKTLSIQKVKEVQDQDQLLFWQGLAEGHLHMTLPSEAEWEKGARGLDGRIYPWGNDFDPDKANVEDTRVGTVTAVGCFTAGASSFGLLDMSGNIWEWTRSLWGKDSSEPEFKYPYEERKKEREDLDASRETLRVLRGGSVFTEAKDTRCAYRNWCLPYEWYINTGFRVVASPLSEA